MRENFIICLFNKSQTQTQNTVPLKSYEFFVKSLKKLSKQHMCDAFKRRYQENIIITYGIKCVFTVTLYYIILYIILYYVTLLYIENIIITYGIKRVFTEKVTL